MSDQILEVTISTADELFRTLEEIAFGDEGGATIFRGHAEADWKIDSTLNRYSSSRLGEYRHYEIDQLVSNLRFALSRQGDHRMEGMDRRQRMEFARHYGVPSPLIDFTLSPYIAIWFALSDAFERGRGNAAVYSLNVQRLGLCFSKMAHVKSFDGVRHRQFAMPPYDVFRWERIDFFQKGYPMGELKFLISSSSWNHRMHNQSGVFIYDSISFKSEGYRDFENIISEDKAFSTLIDGKPIAQKYIFNREIARQVFLRLNRMGVNGARLLGGVEGAAVDVRNPYCEIGRPLDSEPSLMEAGRQ